MTTGAVLGPRIVALLTLCAHPLFGGVVFDGSFGHPGPAPFTNSNHITNFMIPASFGTQRGGNLFQSFSQFNLNRFQTATFTGPTTGPTVHNILARVTSGSASSIDGTVNSSIDGANLFFINPAGVIFGANAKINVSGSFAVTTANYLKLVGGGRFNANLGGDNMLTSAPVSAFGFLNSAPVPVSFTGSNLALAAEKSFSVVAGDITMSGGQISGQGSRVNLVSVRSPGEVQLDAKSIDSAVNVSQFTALGDINLTNQTVIDTSGSGGGPVVVRGGNLSLDNSDIVSHTNGSIHGGSIDIALSQNMRITNGGQILSDTRSSGKGGNVLVEAGSLSIDGSGGPIFSTGIFAESVGAGDAGAITVNIDNALTISTDGAIAGEAFASGKGGSVLIEAGSLSIHGSGAQSITGIFAQTSGAGDAGAVTVRVADALTISAGGEIDTNTFSFGKGGDLLVEAGSLSIDGSGARPGIVTTIAAESVGAGDAGNVTVKVKRALTMTAAGEISAAAFSSGSGGNLLVKAGSLRIDGSAAPGVITGVVANAVLATGDAGNVTVEVNGALTLIGGGKISTGTLGLGAGGNLLVKASSLTIDGSGSQPVNLSGIFANSVSSGNAGSIGVYARDLTITNGGAISSSAAASGGAGSIFIDTTGPITLRHGSSISTSSESGDAGSIDITSGGEIKLKDQSSITVSAGHNGGDIHITAPDFVYLLNSSITATAGANGVNGAGGNITIDRPQFIVLNNSLISANAAAGQGGNIDLISDFFFNSNSSITATGTTNGTVNIAAPALDLGAELITLPTSLLSAESQLQERCAALLQGDFSSFISIGRGGTEPAPEELQTTF